MRREIKYFDKIVGFSLIILTMISLVMNGLYYTYAIYDCTYDVASLNQFLVSKPLEFILWIDNILIYVLGLIYIIEAIKTKKDRLLKVSLSLFSVLTTMIVSTGIINLIASLFGMF